jgi:predicted metalloprotease with PDZ domain
VAFDKRPFRLSVDIDGKKVQMPLIATSFGVAESGLLHKDLPYTVTANEIRRTAFLGGGGGQAIFNAPEGHDEVGWIGYTAFDPRPIAAELAVFRSTLRDHFRSGDIGPQTVLLAVDERPKGHFRVQRRAQGLLIAVSGTDPFEATLRLACATELVHAFIGERLWVGDARPGREGQSLWFHEGYARWVAREQLYRVGLLSPDEYAAEVNRLLSIVTTSPHAQRPLTELATDLKTGGVVPLLVARGALHATLVDQRIRTSKNPKASLDDILRKHFKESEERRPRGPVAEEAWRASIAEIIGPAPEKSDFDDMITTTKRTALPPDALGGCFEPKEMPFDIYDPGFDVSASRDAQKITGVRAHGPAAKAGLRDGDTVIKLEDDPTESKLKVEVERGEGKSVPIAFNPSAGSKKGIGFRRRAGLTDEGCRKLGLRK